MVDHSHEARGWSTILTWTSGGWSIILVSRETRGCDRPLFGKWSTTPQNRVSFGSFLHPLRFRVSESLLLPHSYHGAHVATTCRVRQNGTTQNAQHRNQYASTERHDSREERRAEEVKVVVHLLLSWVLTCPRPAPSQTSRGSRRQQFRGGRRGGRRLAAASLAAVSAAAAAAADTIRTSAAPSSFGSRPTTPRPRRGSSWTASSSSHATVSAASSESCTTNLLRLFNTRTRHRRKSASNAISAERAGALACL